MLLHCLWVSCVCLLFPAFIISAELLILLLVFPSLFGEFVLLVLVSTSLFLLFPLTSQNANGGPLFETNHQISSKFCGICSSPTLCIFTFHLATSSS